NTDGANGAFSLANIDLSGLREGLHVVEFRAFLSQVTVHSVCARRRPLQDEDLPKTLEDRRADGRLREKSAELDNVKSFAQAGEIDVGERERAIRAVGVDEAVGEPLGAAGNRRAPGEGYSAAVEARDRVAGGGIAGQ